MKKIVFLMTVLLTGTFVMAQTSSLSSVATEPLEKRVAFTNGEYKLGKIPLGKPVEFTIEMKNIGHDTVTLLNVQAGCGCTAPNFTPNEKFGPGQTSKILIRFNGGTSGPFTKYSTIFFDGGLSKQVSFSGEGIPETPQAPAQAATAVKSTTPVEKAKVVKN